uniref:Uncharacterized protein n=1 Tax=Cyprinus carpio TaxID=7962 RepID=A0A8C1G7K1_CYPCA
MEVTFQKNPSQKYKYLEAEPKILGVTEIALTVFCNNNVEFLIGIISGSVAIAAQKLHLPTLKACLGMQVVTCVAYTFCLLETFVEPYARITDCWHPYNHSNITHENDTCIQIELYVYTVIGGNPGGVGEDRTPHLRVVPPKNMIKNHAVYCKNQCFTF